MEAYEAKRSEVKLGALLSLLCTTTAFACSSLRYEDDDDGELPPDGPFETPECVIDPDTIIELRDVRTATLVGGILHVEGFVGGADGYALLSLDGSNAELLGLRPDLYGGASWTAGHDDHHVRVVGSRLEVLDASSASAPSVVSSLELGAPPPAEFAGIGADESAVYLCLGTPADSAPILRRIDLSDPLAPGAPTDAPAPTDWGLANFPCTVFGNSGLADGALQLLFDGSDMMLFDLRTSTIAVSHGFATDGVHHYGEFTAIATDGRVVATTLANEAYAFLYYGDDLENDSLPLGGIVYSSFGGGPKQLLEVVTGQAVLAVPAEAGVAIVARDIDPAPTFEEAAPQTEMRVTLSGGSDRVEDYRVLAHDDTRLIVSDGTQLFVVPLGSSAPVAPMVLTEKGSEPICQ